MNSQIYGAGVGLLAGIGLAISVWHAPLRRPRLTDRLAPYVRNVPAPSRLLNGPSSTVGLLKAGRQLLTPFLESIVRFLDKVVGGRASIQHRLAELRSAQTVDDVRMDQVMWAGIGGAGGVLTTGVLVLAVNADYVLVGIALIIGGATLGFLARDWWLGSCVRKRRRQILAEFPVVAELLALAVTAGESLLGAVDRVSGLVAGEIGRDLADALARSRSGIGLSSALSELRDRTGIEAFARFLDGLIIALERGTPLADVLRAQAADAREASKRGLLESGGRREIAMMFPVVFLILPITVLFALFPGLIQLSHLAQ